MVLCLISILEAIPNNRLINLFLKRRCQLGGAVFYAPLTGAQLHENYDLLGSYGFSLSGKARFLHQVCRHDLMVAQKCLHIHCF